MRKQVDVFKSILNDDEFSIEKFGAIIHRGWEMKKRLALNITNPKIDNYYSTACQYGAKGGKISGAGGGGFILFYAEPEAQEKIKQSLDQLTYVPFKFDNTGSQVIYHTHENHI